VNVDRTDRLEAGLRARIARNLVVWGIPTRVAIVLFLTPLPSLPVGLYLSRTYPGWFDWLTDEDHLVEWLQIVALVVAFGAYALLARHHWKAQRRVTAALSVLAMIAIVAVTGEELSWGQRVFGWATPAVIEAINAQGESNIHNIGSIATASRLLQFGAVGYGVFLPLLALFPGMPGRLRYSYFVPPVALVSFFLGPFVYWAIRIPINPTEAIFRVSEIMELSAYGGLAVLGWLSLGRLVLGEPASGQPSYPQTLNQPQTGRPGAP
jgi:hypothetical protein